MRIQPENRKMEPARSRATGILQVREFSTGKGIKPPIEARFLQVKEKRQSPSNLVLQFNPRPAVQMLVACLWDRWLGPNGDILESFAAVTDEPPAEIAATGHQPLRLKRNI